MYFSRIIIVQVFKVALLQSILLLSASALLDFSISVHQDRLFSTVNHTFSRDGEHFNVHKSILCLEVGFIYIQNLVPFHPLARVKDQTFLDQIVQNPKFFFNMNSFPFPEVAAAEAKGVFLVQHLVQDYSEGPDVTLRSILGSVVS